jgi:tetratricopeptide (TPR) repeat protein
MPKRRKDRNRSAQLHKQNTPPRPSTVDCNNLFNKAVYLCKSGDPESAIPLFHAIIAIDKAAKPAYFNLGKAYKSIGDNQQALTWFREAIMLNPHEPNTWIEYAGSLRSIREYIQAISALEHALTLSPHHIGALLNLGLLYYEVSNYHHAALYLRQVLDLQSDNVTASQYLARAFHRLGNSVQSLEVLRCALERHPHSIELQRALAFGLLLEGQFREAWPLYECRFAQNGKNRVLPYCQTGLPLVTTLDNPELRCLIVAEQGLGDNIQFSRFLPAFCQALPYTRFCCPRQIHPILNSSSLHCDTLDLSDLDTSEFDAWIPLLSLPKLLGVDSPNMIQSRPYLKTRKLSHPPIVSAIKSIVGIHWQGSTSHEDGKPSVGRSFPLYLFEPLSKLPNVGLISLQVGLGTEQLQSCTFLESFIRDPLLQSSDSLLETADLIQACDLVITNDTSIAHLAGALGVKTYVLLKKYPDWRWGSKGSTSYWYSSVTLFRQQIDGEWDDVFNNVVSAVTRGI